MIYLERKVDHFLRSWKEDEDRKPLIIKVRGRWERRNPFFVLEKRTIRILFTLIL